MDQSEREKLWGKGPWLDEPDEVEWNYKGIKCAIRRAGLGHLCGYIGVTKLHPWFEKNCEIEVNVHGDINFAKFEQGRWWLGFDCGHTGRDLVPAFTQMFPGLMFFDGGVYKDVAYVRGHVEKLARAAEYVVVAAVLYGYANGWRKGSGTHLQLVRK